MCSFWSRDRRWERLNSWVRAESGRPVHGDHIQDAGLIASADTRVSKLVGEARSSLRPVDRATGPSVLTTPGP